MREVNLRDEEEVYICMGGVTAARKKKINQENKYDMRRETDF